MVARVLDSGNLHMLLGLDGLVQPLVVAAAVHEAAGELVHDDDLAVLHHIVDVPLHEAVGPDGLVDVVGQGGVLRVGQVLDVEGLLGLDAAGGEGDGAGLLIDDVVRVDVDVLLLLVSTLAMRWHFRRETNWSTTVYSWVDFSPWPEMIRGVRASSMRMESTSSTMAK